MSRVLSKKSDYVSDDLSARVKAAVKELNYRPNRVARSLRIQRSSVIGLVISDIQNSFFNTVVKAVEDTAQEHGYSVFLCNSDENKEREKKYLELFLDEQVAGVILTPTQEASPHYQALLDANIPMSVLDRKIPNIPVDTIVTNNQETSRLLVRHLIHQGHQSIAIVLSDLRIATGKERLAGYKQALTEADIPVDERLIFKGEPIWQDGYALAKQLFKLEKTPSAIFTASKMITLGVLRYLYEHDIAIPNDVAIAAYDSLDWMPNAPSLLVAEQPAYELGAQATKKLLARIDNPNLPVEHVVLPSLLRFT